MGSATTPTVLRGLLVPDPRWGWASWSEADSTLTQAGPLPGVPDAQGDSDLVPEAVGSQDTANKLRIRTIRGGHPGIDDARFVARYSTETNWFGWDPHHAISGFEFVDRSTVSGKWTHPHAVTLDDGTVAVAAARDRQVIVVWTRDPTAGTWTSVDVYDRGSAYTYNAYPTLVVLPDGRLLVFFWREHGSSYQVRMHVSADGGATWTVGQKACLPDPIDTGDYTPRRLRAAYLNGQILLVAHLQELATPQEQIRQWASNSFGATFDLVSTLTGQNRGFPDVVAAHGRLYVGYVTDVASGGSSNPPEVRAIGSAYEDLSAASSVIAQADMDPMVWAVTGGGVYTNGDLALWTDDDGALYVCGTDRTTGATAKRDVGVRISTDEGDTWSDISTSPAAAAGVTLWRGRDTSTYPNDYTVTAQHGRGVMLHCFAANPGTAGDSICATYLGGYTTVCLPQEDDLAPDILTVCGWTNTWLPFDMPEDTGDAVPVWVHTSSGTASLGSVGLHLTTGLGQAETFATDAALGDVASTVAQGLMAEFEVKVVSGEVFLELRISDATPLQYRVQAFVSTTQIRLYDVAGGVDIGTVTTTDGTGWVQLLMQLSGSTAKLWYRVVGSAVRKWTLVGSTSAVTSAATNDGNRINWGQGQSSESQWRLVQFSGLSYIGEGILDQSNPDDLFGRSWRPTPVYVIGGTKVQAVDGPTFRNDEWNIDPRYQYPVSNLFPDVSTSPRRPWRSTADNADVEIAVTMGSSVTVPMGALAGVGLIGANFGQAEWHGQDAGGAWHKIADIDLRHKTALKFTRQDRVVLPDTSGGDTIGRFLATNTLAGARFRLDGTHVRKIRMNSEGTWTNGGSSLATRILLEDTLTGGEPTSGSTGAIWYPNAVAAFALTTAYKAYKLKIPAQTTAEGYFELGNLLFGHVFPLGGYLMQYGWGRGQEWATSVEQVEGRTGIRVLQSLAPTRRAAELAWVDGVETAGLSDTSPNWVVGWTGGQPVVVPAGVPYSLPGLVSSLRGAYTPVTYLAAFGLPSSSSDVVMITDPNLLLYGSVVSQTLRADTVLGEEGGLGGTGELIRLGTCRIEAIT
jgi:hypothetical protein